MKREGRQHGMVRSFRILPSVVNPRPATRFAYKLDSPPTFGLFTKVPSKPTNHSKFTSKCCKSTPRCVSCHVHPASKSRDKAKGTYKLNSWRVVGTRPGLSANRILDRISDDENYSEDFEEEEEEIDVSVNSLSYSFADLFRENDDGEKGIDDDVLISEMEEDGDWCLVKC